MKTKALLVLLLSILLTLPGYSQLEEMNFNDQLQVKFSVRLAWNQAMGPSEDSIKNIAGIFIRPLELDRIQYGKGGYQASHRWSFIMESLTGALADAINGGGFEWGVKKTSTNIGDFILGWHNHAWSIFSTSETQVMAGVHWGDYFFGFEPHSGNRRFEKANEPAGWYGVAGPALMIDQAITNGLVLHGEGSYGLSMKWAEFPDMHADPDYPDPHFLNLNLHLRTNTLFYGGLEYIRSIDQGDHNINAARTDIFIGIWL